MPDKIKTAHICLLINGWLDVAVVLLFSVIFISLVGLMASSSNSLSPEDSNPMIIGFGIATLLLLAAATISFLVAWGVKRKKNWAKIVGIIFAILNLSSFPVGTILGILILLGLFSQEANVWFSTKRTTTKI